MSKLNHFLKFLNEFFLPRWRGKSDYEELKIWEGGKFSLEFSQAFIGDLLTARNKSATLCYKINPLTNQSRGEWIATNEAFVND